MTAPLNPFAPAPETGFETPIFVRRRKKFAAFGFASAFLLAGLYAYSALFHAPADHRTDYPYLAAGWFVIGLLYLWRVIERRPLAIVAKLGFACPRLFDGTIQWRLVRACEPSRFSPRAVLRIFVYPGAYDGISSRRFKAFPTDHFDVDLANCKPGANIVVAVVAEQISAARAARPPNPAFDLIDEQMSTGGGDQFAIENRPRWRVVAFLILIALFLIGLVAASVRHVI